MLAGYETTRFKSKASPTATKLVEVTVVDASSGTWIGQEMRNA